MTEDNAFDPLEIATVTVTFNPDIEQLRTQFAALPTDSLKLVVDNASQSQSLQDLRMLVSRTPNARLLCNDENLGLAAAINRGVRTVHESVSPSPFVLLLDQDSEPMPGSIKALLAGFEALKSRGERVACVGPALVDVTTGLPHGFHQSTRWRWIRIYPSQDAKEPVPCVNLNGSGTLVRASLFLELGGLEEALFIDHVDTEWAFRVQSRGYRLFGISQAIFRHRMGDASRRIWLFGWRVWPVRSPHRHYFLYRNTVILLRLSYVPRVWKIWAVAKLGITACMTLATGPRRIAQLRSMAAGMRDAHSTAVGPKA